MAISRNERFSRGIKLLNDKDRAAFHREFGKLAREEEKKILGGTKVITPVLREAIAEAAIQIRIRLLQRYLTKEQYLGLG